MINHTFRRKNTHEKAHDKANDKFIVSLCTSFALVASTASEGTKISIIAGTGTAGYPGDREATSAQLNDPRGLTVDSNGDMYIADPANQRIRKVDKLTGIISTVAGIGESQYYCRTENSAETGSWNKQ
jgi:hypothetical protein